MLKGQRLMLRFDAVTHNARVFLDGQLLCTHRGGFLPFEADVTDILHPGQTALLEVEVDNTISHHTLPVGNEGGTAFFGSDNAGIPADKLLLRMTEADFDNVLATNLKGAFFCTKAACRFMMHQRYGRIISVSSVVGLHGNAGQANYAASKAGLIGLTKSAAKEYAARNITANVVAPGFIATDMTAVLSEPARAAAEAAIPAGKIGHAEDVAAAVAFLAGEQAGYITGQVLCVDGGMGM